MPVFATISPVAGSPAGGSSWVYLGNTKEDKWQAKYFDIAGRPRTQVSYTATGEVYTRDDKPRQVGSDWALGSVKEIASREY
jgi:hypothetical protein